MTDRFELDIHIYLLRPQQSYYLILKKHVWYIIVWVDNTLWKIMYDKLLSALT